MRPSLALVAALVVSSTCFVGIGAAAHENPRLSILGVELDAEGDAVVYYIQSYDLNDSDQRERYDAVADNRSRRIAYRDERLAELRSAAASGRNRTDLDMQIRNASVRAFEQDGYGRLSVRAEWENLGFYNERRVVVTEPFRGGYEPDPRRVAIHGPEGYRRGTMRPLPTRGRENSVLWSPPRPNSSELPQTSNFSEFYAEFENPDVSGSDSGDGDTDGRDDADSGIGDAWGSGDFGPLLGALLIALVPVAIVLLAVRQRQH